MLSYTYALQSESPSAAPSASRSLAPPTPPTHPASSADVYFHNTTVHSAAIASPVQSKYGSKTRLGNPRIYDCSQCSRAFTREEHLTRHTLSTHNKLKPFACGICLRAFLRRDLLLRHAKNLHGGSELAVMRLRKSYKATEPQNAGPTRVVPINPLASPSSIFQYSAGHVMDSLLGHTPQFSSNSSGLVASMSPLCNPRSALESIHLAPISMSPSMNHETTFERSRFSPYEQPESRLKMSVSTLVG